MHQLILFIPEFQNYGSEHLIWLLLGTVSATFWIWLGKSQSTEAGQRRIGLIQSLIPVLLWASISLYMALFESPVEMGLVLPFHACYFINLLLPVMLWQRSFLLFEITYFMVMGGCAQALITPDVQYSFPHYMNLRYFIVHMGLVQSILYALLVFRFRPNWSSYRKAFLWVNIYFVFVLGINFLLGTNFMYLSKKPNAPTLLDLFGEWPWYIVGGEFLALAMFALVMLPFAFDNRRRLSTSNTGT